MSLPVIKKRSEEQYFVGLKFVPPDLERDQSIINVTTSVEPDVGGGLELVGPPEIDDDQVSQLISGGVDGDEYYVKFLVEISNGNIYEESIFVTVRDFVP